MPISKLKPSFATLAISFIAGVALLSSVSARADNPQVVIETNHGNIQIELLAQLAPRTVKNFLRLVDENFYDDLIFHRVIANFMIQAGGYTQDMKYREDAVTIPNESFNGVRNTRGTVAMARLTDPDSAGTQFFINVRDNPNLDAQVGKPGYSVFGRVAGGMDVVTTIELSDTHLFQGHSAVPMQPVVIKTIRRVE